MKKTTVIDKEGNSYSSNFLLDDIIDSFEKKGINNGENDDLIIELTIQKFEYGRTCIAQLISKGGETAQNIKDYYFNLDIQLQNKIVELKGNPVKKRF